MSGYRTGFPVVFGARTADGFAFIREGTPSKRKDSDDSGNVGRDPLRRYDRWNGPKPVRGVRKQEVKVPPCRAGRMSSVLVGVVAPVGQQLRVGTRLLVQERRDLVGSFVLGSLAGMWW